MSYYWFYTYNADGTIGGASFKTDTNWFPIMAAATGIASDKGIEPKGVVITWWTEINEAQFRELRECTRKESSCEKD